MRATRKLCFLNSFISISTLIRHPLDGLVVRCSIRFLFTILPHSPYISSFTISMIKRLDIPSSLQNLSSARYASLLVSMGMPLTSPSLVIKILAHVFPRTDFLLLNIVLAYTLVYSSGLCSCVNHVLKRLSKFLQRGIPFLLASEHYPPRTSLLFLRWHPRAEV